MVMFARPNPAPQTTAPSSLFGNLQTQVPSASSSSTQATLLFGAPATAPTAAPVEPASFSTSTPTPSLFGKPPTTAAAGRSAFGSSTSTPSLFGTSTKPFGSSAAPE